MITSYEAIEIESKSPVEPIESRSLLPVEYEQMETTTHEVPDETLYMIGRPTLKQFLRFVKNHAVIPPSEGDLTEEWQAANTIVRSIEHDEAGLADDPPISKLGPEYTPLLIEFLKDPL